MNGSRSPLAALSLGAIGVVCGDIGTSPLYAFGLIMRAGNHPAKLLDQSSTRPTHVLPNKIPLYRDEDFVATQNIGEGSYAPLRVFNKRRFIRSIVRNSR